MELILDDHPSSVAPEISTSTAETCLPSPQQTSWCKSLNSRRDSAHVLPLQPHKVSWNVARYPSTLAHSDLQHISTPVIPIASLPQIRASSPISITKENGCLMPQLMEVGDDVLLLNEVQASLTEMPELPTSNSSSFSKALYKIVSQVGEGSFGKVYKAWNTLTGKHVALKHICIESEWDNFPVTAMWEIKLLQSLWQEIVRLFEMMVYNGESQVDIVLNHTEAVLTSGAVYIVFEYMDHDLTGVLSQSQFTFSDALLILSHPCQECQLLLPDCSGYAENALRLCQRRRPTPMSTSGPHQVLYWDLDCP